jgi:hypothetical protein
MHSVSSVGSDRMLDEIMDSEGDPVELAMRMTCTDAEVIRSNAESSTLLF